MRVDQSRHYLNRRGSEKTLLAVVLGHLDQPSGGLLTSPGATVEDERARARADTHKTCHPSTPNAPGSKW